MRWKLSTWGFLAALLVAPAAVWAAAPFGFVDDPGIGVPGASGIHGLTGWALDDQLVDSVDVLVDGVIAGRAIYYTARPDVTVRYPGFPNSAAPGWVYNLDTTQYLNGLHTVSALVTSSSGEQAFLNAVLYEFSNATANLVPFGAVDYPLPNTELFGNCNLADPARRYAVISGYALDPGIEIGDSGVGYVELLIDGALWANSRVDCVFESDEPPGRCGLSDCYGLRRFDVERSYPTLRDAPHSGFRFVIDVGFLIEALDRVPGFHLLSIRAGDVKGQVAEIAEVPVTFFCDDFIDNEGSFGDLDLPSSLVFSGTQNITGWALDREGVAEVQILIDGVRFGSATFGLPRPIVKSLFCGYPDSSAPSWRFSLDSTLLANGPHDLQVVVRDQSPAAQETIIGERAFTVVNP